MRASFSRAPRVGVSGSSSKPLLRKYTALEVTSYAIWAGTVLLSPFIVQLAHEVHTAPGRASAAVLYLGIVPSAIGYVSWAFVLSKIEATRAASFLYLIPPIAVLLAWLGLGERPGSLALAGGSRHPSGRRSGEHASGEQDQSFQVSSTSA